jgi:hypothetical protein
LYSPDLAPFDYHLFGFVKNWSWGQYYETNEALQTAVHQCTVFSRSTVFQGSGENDRWMRENGKSGKPLF